MLAYLDLVTQVLYEGLAVVCQVFLIYELEAVGDGYFAMTDVAYSQSLLKMSYFLEDINMLSYPIDSRHLRAYLRLIWSAYLALALITVSIQAGSYSVHNCLIVIGEK